MSATRRLSLLTILLSTTLLLGACSSATQTDEADKTADTDTVKTLDTENLATTTAAIADELQACTLLNKTDMEEVTGLTLTLTEGSRDDWCMYSAAGFRSYASLLYTKNTSAARAASDFEVSFSMSQEISGVAPVRVTGIGDSAFYAAGALNQLNVLKDSYWFIITVSLPDATQNESKAREAAAMILARY